MRRWPPVMVLLRRSPPAYPVSIRQKMQQVAIITMTSVRQRLVAIVVADVDPLQSISRPHSAPAIVVVVGGVDEGRAKEGEAVEATMEEAVMEAGVEREALTRHECGTRREGRPRETSAAEMRAYHASGARAYARAEEASTAEMWAYHASGARA